MIFYKKHPLSLLSVVLIFISGCAIAVGPNLLPVSPLNGKPIVRIGKVEETLTGTWASYPNVGFRSAMEKALKRKEFSSHFSNEAPLVLNVRLTSDHADDNPRALTLAVMSGITFGFLPLTYDSVWNIQCEAIVQNSGGSTVAQYILQEAGTYHICCFPWTPVSLFFAALRGRGDSRKMADQTTFALAAKIMSAIEADYLRLVPMAGQADTVKALAPPSSSGSALSF